MGRMKALYLTAMGREYSYALAARRTACVNCRNARPLSWRESRRRVRHEESRPSRRRDGGGLHGKEKQLEAEEAALQRN